MAERLASLGDPDGTTPRILVLGTSAGGGDWPPLPEPLSLEGVKLKVSAQGIRLKMVDHDTQKPTTESWDWMDLF